MNILIACEESQAVCIVGESREFGRCRPVKTEPKTGQRPSLVLQKLLQPNGQEK